jgi:kynurenine 3-monooxygenase
MSSKTADADFLLQKKIEKQFSTKHPDKWIPAYSRVTFSERPYSEALAEGDAQESIMKEVMKMPGIAQKWDSEEVEKKMLELIG